MANSFHTLNVSAADIPMLGFFALHRDYRRSLHGTLLIDLSGAIQEGDQILREQQERVQPHHLSTSGDPFGDAVLEVAESLAQPTPKQLVALRKCVGPNAANNWFLFHRGVQQLDTIVHALEDFYQPDGPHTESSSSTMEKAWLYCV